MSSIAPPQASPRLGAGVTRRPAVLHSLSISAVERLARSERRLAAWLTAREREIFTDLRVPKRAREWLAGRLAAKEAIRRRHGLRGETAFRRIEVLAVQSGTERGRPYYLIDGSGERSFGLSIAHSGDVAVAMLAENRGGRVGVDVEHLVEARPGFETLLLSPPERRRLEGVAGVERRRALSRLWVLKEALSKALGVGLRLPLPDIRVAGECGQAPTFTLPPGTETRLGAQEPRAAAFERDGRWFAWVTLGSRARAA